MNTTTMRFKVTWIPLHGHLPMGSAGSETLEEVIKIVSALQKLKGRDRCRIIVEVAPSPLDSFFTRVHPPISEDPR